MIRNSTLLFACLTWLLIFSVAIPTSVLACLWDHDTLRVESLGLPGVLEAITGHFEQNPPRYYQMRLERVMKELEKDPSQLALYDNAGVACDRLGKSDEAISWMVKKKQQIDLLSVRKQNPAKIKEHHIKDHMKEHHYRYLANLGTFYIHRWLKNGADQNKMEDVALSRKFIAEAIKLNPNAHFGREKVQLLAIRWVQNPPELGRRVPTIFKMNLALPKKEQIATSDFIQGITGMIVMGAAWESVDLMAALEEALVERGSAYLAHAVRLHREQLVTKGKRSIHPYVTKIIDLEEHFSLTDPPRNEDRYPALTRRKPDIEKTYRVALESAKAWQEKRWAYMEKQFTQGKHPDTDSNFWNDFSEPRPPKVEFFGQQYASWTPSQQIAIAGTIAAAIGLLFLGLIGFFVVSLAIKASCSFL